MAMRSEKTVLMLAYIAILILIIAISCIASGCTTTLPSVKTQTLQAGWTMEDESSVNNYVLQHSDNSINWVAIDSVRNNGSKNYFIDTKETNGYFRLKINGDNSIVYTKIIYVR